MRLRDDPLVRADRARAARSAVSLERRPGGHGHDPRNMPSGMATPTNQQVLAVAPAGRVSFTFELTTPACPVRDRFQSQAQDAIMSLGGVSALDVRMTANVRPAF